MARSLYSPSLSPISPSPSLGATTDDQQSTVSEHRDGGGPGSSHSRPVSPSADTSANAEASADTVTCLWEDCGHVFFHLPTLIKHIHEEHIGVHKSNYTCEWATCSRRSLPQTSRFALISHIRSHTGEKPFTCLRPECDKSFTRSDALAKHMRLQHNIEPPLPGRGGNRKRKRDDVEPDVPSAVPSSHGGGFNTFKVEPHTPGSDLDDISATPPIDQKGDYFSTQGGHAVVNGGLPRRSNSPGGSVDGADHRDDLVDDGIPPHLLNVMDPQTGLILGRSPDMVRYLVIKAKHRYALEQHEHLIEELRIAKYELKRVRAEKEAALDETLRVNFGSHANEFIELVLPVEVL